MKQFKVNDQAFFSKEKSAIVLLEEDYYFEVSGAGVDIWEAIDELKSFSLNQLHEKLSKTFNHYDNGPKLEVESFILELKKNSLIYEV